MSENPLTVKSAPIPSWDTAVSGSTIDFTADGETVLLLLAADTRTFRVSRALLAHWLPVFRDMFTSSTGDSVTLHNDADDLRSLLWFIHVDPISFADYNAKCPAAEKFRRALGIATIANFYGSSSITKWAVAELLARLFTCCTAELLPRLHRLATACSDVSPKFHAAVRQQWCTMIGTTTDPVATLCAAKEIDDTYLQAYAYFHVLQKTNGEISKDARLTPLDRMRLLVGSMNLRRYDDMDCPCTDLGTYHRSSGGESLGDAEITGGSWNTVGRGNLGGRWHPGGRGSPGGRGHMGARDHPGDRKHKLPRPQATTDAQLWSPKTSAPLQDSYEQHSLWDMFTVSPVGLVLHDGVELSQPSIPQ